MHLLLIDHITKVEPKNMIKDTKNVAMSDDFLEFHFP
jgi:3-hydroxymyristoyl/3-hydroxydecanoyl-(acyl carrier protein) dehydratase